MEKKPVKRATLLEEALADLTDAEEILAKLEGSDTFEAFSRTQKQSYYETLAKLRDLMLDLGEDTSREQIAS